MSLSAQEKLCFEYLRNLTPFAYLYYNLNYSRGQSMYSEIKFGTDGWRAVTDKDFNETNVNIAVCAIAKYVYDNFGADKQIIIGYDPRNKAHFFAEFAAKILSDFGFNVLLSDKVIPTPVLAFNAKYLNACALMFTASHNPPEYLGLKFIPDYAGPATSDITDEITQNLGKSFNKFSDEGTGTLMDFTPAYFDHLKNLIDFEKIREYFSLSGSPKIIFDGLYSATIGYFDKILDIEKIPFETLHMFHDVNFGGVMPEPKPQYLSELIEKIKSDKNSLGFANDGDGDRFGVINENGEYVTPNEIIGILLLHLIKHKNYKGSLVKTVGASSMLNILAKKLGIELIETPVGFKYVGEAMRKHNPVIAGEDSGGLSIQNHIPEKDGILANLLILEAIAYSGKSLCELQKGLKNIVGCEFYNTRIDKKLSDNSEITVFKEKFKNLENVGDYKIVSKDFIDGIKLFIDDCNWILARPSGTEPLLRIYIETNNENRLKELKNILENI